MIVNMVDVGKFLFLSLIAVTANERVYNKNYEFHGSETQSERNSDIKRRDRVILHTDITQFLSNQRSLDNSMVTIESNFAGDHKSAHSDLRTNDKEKIYDTVTENSRVIFPDDNSKMKTTNSHNTNQKIDREDREQNVLGSYNTNLNKANSARIKNVQYEDNVSNFKSVDQNFDRTMISNKHKIVSEHGHARHDALRLDALGGNVYESTLSSNKKNHKSSKDINMYAFNDAYNSNRMQPATRDQRRHRIETNIATSDFIEKDGQDFNARNDNIHQTGDLNYKEELPNRNNGRKRDRDQTDRELYGYDLDNKRVSEREHSENRNTKENSGYMKQGLRENHKGRARFGESTEPATTVNVDDRAAFSVNRCATGMARVNTRCVPID